MKLTNCPDKYFISPTVNTVKKYQSIKLVLDSKLLNQAIHKKYQLPITNTLIEPISQQISAPASQNTTYFSRLDLKYAYIQLKLDPNTANHCNFSISRGDITDSYEFQIDFYGLTDILAEFQKAMGHTLIGLMDRYYFLDDILLLVKDRKKSKNSMF